MRSDISRGDDCGHLFLWEDLCRRMEDPDVTLRGWFCSLKKLRC